MHSLPAHSKSHPSILRLLCGLWFAIAMFSTPSSHAQENALHTAAATGDVTALRQALAAGAAINAQDANGATPLLIATERNHIDAARVLIDAGADVNIQNQMRNSPYLYAGARGLNDILRMTLSHGAKLNSTNRYDGTALIPAAERGYVETVRILIAAEVDVNHVNRLHWTALLEAIILGTGGAEHTQIVRDLVAAGADVNIADGEGVTPLQHARRRGYRDIAKILEDAGGR